MPTAFQHYSSVIQWFQMSFSALMQLRLSKEMSELRMSWFIKSGLKCNQAHFVSNSISQTWSPDSISWVDFSCLYLVCLIKTKICHGLSQKQIEIYCIRLIAATDMQWRLDSRVLTRSEVGENTPCLSRALSVTQSWCACSFSLATMKCLWADCSLHPPRLLFTILCTQPFATSVRLALVGITSFPTLSPVLLSSLHLHLFHPMGA